MKKFDYDVFCEQRGILRSKKTEISTKEEVQLSKFIKKHSKYEIDRISNIFNTPAFWDLVDFMWIRDKIEDRGGGYSDIIHDMREFIELRAKK